MYFMIAMVVFKLLFLNDGPSSSRRPNKPSFFMVLQCKVIGKRYVKSLILQKFGINQQKHAYNDFFFLHS
jgi:hypothetical protein